MNNDQPTGTQTTKIYDVECFLVEALPVVDVTVRRFVFDNVSCPHGDGFGHDALTILGTEERAVRDPEVNVVRTEATFRGDPVAAEDPRWPARCQNGACDYAFSPKDPRATYRSRRWRGPGGEEYRTADLPVGAVGQGEDGGVFVVIPEHPHEGTERKMPWMLDGDPWYPEAVGKRWRHFGELPRITVAQPINSPLGFRGQIVDGRIYGVVVPPLRDGLDTCARCGEELGFFDGTVLCDEHQREMEIEIAREHASDIPRLLWLRERARMERDGREVSSKEVRAAVESRRAEITEAVTSEIQRAFDDEVREMGMGR